MKGKYTVNEVEARTKVPATTLRQWERRYGFPQPERSESGYRLYNDIDLQHISIMKRYIDDGVPPSRAAILVKQTSREPQSPRSLMSLHKDLVKHLVDLDEIKALAVLHEAYALFSVEQVMFEVMMPAMVDVGDMWHRGLVNTTVEHFATTFIQGRLHALLGFSPNVRNAPAVIVACAPGEQHELAALMLAVCLRRTGYSVYYLGANTPIEDLLEMSRKVSPVAVMISAATPGALEELSKVQHLLRQMSGYLVFGGRAFKDKEANATSLGGLYLGGTIPEVIEHFDRLIQGGKAL